jgi:hypothetical protein
MRDMLRKHDAVFWIDSDAAFADHGRDLSEWLDGSADIVGCTDRPNGPYSINTGTMLIKKTKWSVAFLDAWWECRELSKYATWAFEQEALHDMITSDTMKCMSDNKIRIAPHDEFNSAFTEISTGRRDTFVLHFMACSAVYRRRELLHLIRRLHLPAGP